MTFTKWIRQWLQKNTISHENMTEKVYLETQKVNEMISTYMNFKNS